MPIAPEIFKAYDIRGLHGDQLDGEGAEQIGRAFVRVLADLAGKAAGALRIGLGRDMRLTAPELSARYRAGMVAEGAHVLDAGMVGTEMLYFLVGSRELDGGLMCTASHNPKAYTGAKLVRAEALAAQRRRGHPRHPPHHRGGARGGRRRRLSRGGRRRAPSSTPPPCASSTPPTVTPLKVVVDGGNGMAGPMVGPLLERLGLELVTTYWEPDGDFPDHEPNPLLEENRRFIVDKVRETGADLGIAWDGDADRCFFIDDTGRVRRRRLPHRDPGRAPPGQARIRSHRPRGDPLRRPRLARGGRCRGARRRRRRTPTASATPSSRRACATRARSSAARSPATTTSTTSTTRTRGRSRRCSCWRSCRSRASGSASCSSPTARATSSRARSTPRWPTARRRWPRIEERYADARISHLDGVSVDYDDWHFNVRPSNTEPLLRLCLESLVSEHDMERRRDEVLALIRS